MNSLSCQSGMPERASGLIDRRDRKNEGRHDVEAQAPLSGDGERLRYVWRFHEAEVEDHAGEVAANLLQLHPLLRVYARNWLDDDSEDHIAMNKTMARLLQTITGVGVGDRQRSASTFGSSETRLSQTRRGHNTF
jgi:hypothetical protein